ncbi:MAG: pentapeptide repeat-containing protein [Arsenophonus endosymbiont of Dermacentor nuttalli]
MSIGEWFYQLRTQGMGGKGANEAAKNWAVQSKRALGTVDAEQLNVLRELIVNREANTIIDLVNTDLSDLNFSNYFDINLDLSWVNLSKTDLSRSKLYKVNLVKAKLDEANLMQADLTDASMMGANLRDTKLNEATLVSTNLRSADLRKAILNRKLTKSQLILSKLNYAMLNKADIKQCGADLC